MSRAIFYGSFPCFLFGWSDAHGHLTLPPSRNGGTLEKAANCENGECFWFSQPALIPGEPTNNDERHRTYNVKVNDGPRDWSRKSPWRAPGTAPVLGSGCGLAGGNAKVINNGGIAPDGVQQGVDGLTLPSVTSTIWERGTAVEVGHAIHCNHGGGYSYRLCRNEGGNVTEECFQRGALRFESDASYIHYDANLYKGHSIPRQEIPNDRIAEGTYPAGSEWKKNPVPPCEFCDAADCDGEYLSLEWERCAAGCAGHGVPVGCPAGLTQFPEPLPGVSGWPGRFGHDGGTDPTDPNFEPDSPTSNNRPGDYFPFSVVDKVLIPEDLEVGEYVMSWRWDCEQSSQIWLNCADVTIVEPSRSVAI
jgi:hypothetical protein